VVGNAGKEHGRIAWGRIAGASSLVPVGHEPLGCFVLIPRSFIGARANSNRKGTPNSRQYFPARSCVSRSRSGPDIDRQCIGSVPSRCANMLPSCRDPWCQPDHCTISGTGLGPSESSVGQRLAVIRTCHTGRSLGMSMQTVPQTIKGWFSPGAAIAVVFLCVFLPCGRCKFLPFGKSTIAARV